MQCAILSQAQDLRFSKVFYSPNLKMLVTASTEAGQDSLLIISRKGYYGSHGSVHLMDATGVMHWSKNLVREGTWIDPVDIVRTADRNFLICASEGRYPEKISILLIKLNAAGDLLWVKKFEHIINADPYGMALSANGDILVTGRTQPLTPEHHPQLLLLRLTGDGALLWGKTYERDFVSQDIGLAVVELANGQLIVGGGTHGFQPYSTELSLTKTDAGGNVLWAKRKVSPSYDYQGGVDDLISGPSGFYLYGRTQDAPEMVMAFSTDGEIIWSKSFHGLWFGRAQNYYRGRINTAATGNLLVSHGWKMGESGFVSQITPEGSLVWSQHVDMFPIEAKPLLNGGYLFLGLGPLTGSKEVEQPQTGVIRTNALGEGVSCTSEDDKNLVDYVPVFEGFTYTVVSDVGIVFDYSLQWEEFPLDSFDGCVTIVTAVKDIPFAANALKVYPNPGNGPFRLMLDDMQSESVVQLSVYNSKGQNVYSREGDWSRLQVINQKLAAGLYLINVKTPTRVFTTRLIVK